MTDARLTGFQPVVELVDRMIESGVQYPKVRLSFAEQPLVLSMTKTGRNAGAVNLTDGGKYSENRWYGRIQPDGVLFAGEAMRNLEHHEKKALWAILCRMRDGEAEAVFSEYGHTFGVCCLCGRELTNDKSVEMGIGPVCRKNAFGVDDA